MSPADGEARETPRQWVGNDIRLVHGDSTVLMRTLPRGFANLVLTDLPWGETQAEWDQPIDLDYFWWCVNGVVARAAKIVLFSSLKHALDVIPAASKRGWPLAHDLVWEKTVATGFYDVANEPLRSHELVLVFARERGTYNPQIEDGFERSASARRKAGRTHGGYGADVETFYEGRTTRHPRSVLHFSSVGTRAPNRRHSAQKPVPLLRWLIRSYTDPGDTVFDPCTGSFSVGEAAEAEGCLALGIEASLEHCLKNVEHLGLTEARFGG